MRVIYFKDLPTEMQCSYVRMALFIISIYPLAP